MTRNLSIDITKGIAILLVVLGHTEGLGHGISHFIYSFHMPLFFILDGYFFTTKNCLARMKNDARRLIAPYALSVMLLAVWFTVLGIKYHDFNMVWRTFMTASFGSGQFHDSPIWGDFPTIGMIWFLLALFWCREIYNAIGNYCGHWKYIAGGCIAICATLIDKYIINLPLGVLTGASAIMYYMLGNLLHDYQHNIKQYKTPLTFLGILCWGAALCFSSLGMARCQYHLYPLDIAGACGATWVVYLLSTAIDRYTRHCASILSWFGRNSMTILCAHFLEESSFLWEHIHVPNHWHYILPLRLCVIIMFTLVAYRIVPLRNIYGISR